MLLLPCFSGLFAARKRSAAVWAIIASAAEREDDSSASGSLSASYPVLYSGSRFGAFPASVGTASFCFFFGALFGPSQNKFERSWQRCATQTSSGPRQESTPWH